MKWTMKWNSVADSNDADFGLSDNASVTIKGNVAGNVETCAGSIHHGR